LGRVKKLVLLATTLLWLSLPTVAFAYNPLSGACGAQNGAGGGSVACGTNGSDPITGQNGAIEKAAFLLAGISGIVAVIIIIVAGFMYVSSNGNAQKAEAARSAIIGAIVGLVIIAAAASIITFVVGKIG
jgi:type IV secretory pathway VirB2 component (pilin)